MPKLPPHTYTKMSIRKGALVYRQHRIICRLNNCNTEFIWGMKENVVWAYLGHLDLIHNFNQRAFVTKLIHLKKGKDDA